MAALTSEVAENLWAEPRGVPPPDAPAGEAPYTPDGLRPAPRAAQSAETQNHIEPRKSAVPKLHGLAINQK